LFFPICLYHFHIRTHQSCHQTMLKCDCSSPVVCGTIGVTFGSFRLSRCSTMAAMSFGSSDLRLRPPNSFSLLNHVFLYLFKVKFFRLISPHRKMPSESSFKKQAALVQDLLKNFTAVQHLKSTLVLKAAISELIDSTIAFNHFIPFFLAHPLFQEIPPAVFHVLEKFLHKNPNFDMPSGYAKIVKLDARVRDSLTPSKGTSPFFLCLGILSYLFILFQIR